MSRNVEASAALQTWGAFIRFAGTVTPSIELRGRTREPYLASVGHGRLDGIDQGRGALVNGGHADAERLRIVTLRVPPAGDAVDGAQQQVQPEPRADGMGDGF